MVIISNMPELPEKCSNCPCLNSEYGTCNAENRYIYGNRPNWCPLKEIAYCKDCKHHIDEDIDKQMIWCKLHDFARPEWHYCADGTRK